jgi:DNA-binding transcriptional LysR family regulator
MDKLSAIQTFIRVAEAGSFSSVAKELGTTQSSVSKSVAALEKDLGTQLLSRTTRSISLTEEGERYFEQVRRLVAEIQDAELALKKGEHQISGILRVAASVGYGRKVLMPLIDQFLQNHPEVKIDLNLNDGFIDIVEQGIDVAIRIGDLPDSSLLARRIGTTHRALMASKEYLRKTKKLLTEPKTPADLEQHNCVIYTGLQSKNVWKFSSQDGSSLKVRVSGSFQSNSSEAIRAAGISGMGLCYSPTWLFDEELQSGVMKVLLVNWPMRPLPIHAVYPPQRKNSAKVKAFVEHLSRHIGKK